MHMGGHEVLVGVGYLDRLGWYNVTVMDVDKVIDRSLFLPIGLLLGAIMVALAAIIGLVFKRSVLDRLARVEAGFRAVNGGKFAPAPIDAGHDEIGRLSRSFAAMADAVSDNTKMLEHMVEDRTDELRQLAYRDQLTGIPNRRGFAEAYDRISSSGRSRLALLLIDIDAFKAVNDLFGHRAGDMVVAETARRLSGMVRQADACGRWGGDEFILLVNGIGELELGAVAEAIRVALASRPVEIGEGRQVAITVSIGASEMDAGESLDVAVELADAALYRAKADGRNRAVAFDAEWQARRRA